MSATGIEMWARAGSTLASFMFFWAIISQYLPPSLKFYFENTLLYSLFSLFDPYVTITINEFSGDRLSRSKAFTAIQAYLSHKTWNSAKRLKAESLQGSCIAKLALSMDENETISEDYKGAKVWWVCNKLQTSNNSSASHSYMLFRGETEKRAYKLKFHQRYRDVVTEDYLEFVVKKGMEIMMDKRQRKLYTNSASCWSHVVFEHPATFESLAIEAEKKQDIIEDLVCFSKSEDFYKAIGKAWKRGYLLYGPPGTGKSTTIAAMANLLNYDVYDLELTSVKSNNELKRLLIQTTTKSIIVIEDIDCSHNLAGKRKNKVENESIRSQGENNEIKPFGETGNDSGSNVTLSGLLNFIDGLWSASGGERLIVFTTNFVEKLDPALIRRGRMDKHIELSYCSFEGFKVLAKNYLHIEKHETFDLIERLIEETNITPADVAENLMPTSPREDPKRRLMKLIHALEEKKAEMKKEKPDEVEQGPLVEDTVEVPDDKSI
ncbi:hypothetical protein QQ045_028324 [Rhodiola kirilowii]